MDASQEGKLEILSQMNLDVLVEFRRAQLAALLSTRSME